MGSLNACQGARGGVTSRAKVSALNAPAPGGGGGTSWQRRRTLTNSPRLTGFVTSATDKPPMTPGKASRPTRLGSWLGTDELKAFCTEPELRKRFAVKKPRACSRRADASKLAGLVPAVAAGSLSASSLPSASQSKANWRNPRSALRPRSLHKPRDQ